MSASEMRSGARAILSARRRMARSASSRMGEVSGLVLEFDEQWVTVDFNHPLAGRTILFDVLVHRVEAAEVH